MPQRSPNPTRRIPKNRLAIDIPFVLAVAAALFLLATAPPAGANELESSWRPGPESALGPSPGPGCQVPPLDRLRSIAISQEPEILDRFPLRRLLDQIIELSGGAKLDADGLFRQWWAGQRQRTLADPPEEPRCDDDGASLGGFPLECPRPEAIFENHPPETHLPVALFNRFDLAPQDGAHCGEYRVVYAKDEGAVGGAGARNLLIFEGVLPNPNPSCGLEGCRPVAEFWAELSSIEDVGERADRLETFFFDGLEAADGTRFQAVVRPEHYGLPIFVRNTGYVSRGQIRTNQRFDLPWSLREFQLDWGCSEGGCRVMVVPRPVANNPHPTLWRDPVITHEEPADGPAAFQAAFLEQMELLIPWKNDGINQFTMETLPSHLAAESISSEGLPETNDYLPGPSFTAAIEARLAELGDPGMPPYDALDIAQRATAQSCAGCHQLAGRNFDRDLGNGVEWPLQVLQFVHVSESGSFSHALIAPDGFLNHRLDVLEQFLGIDCNSGCGGLEGASTESLGERATISVPGYVLDAEGRLKRALVRKGTRETLGGSVVH